MRKCGSAGFIARLAVLATGLAALAMVALAAETRESQPGELFPNATSTKAPTGTKRPTGPRDTTPPPPPKHTPEPKPTAEPKPAPDPTPTAEPKPAPEAEPKTTPEVPESTAETKPVNETFEPEVPELPLPGTTLKGSKDPLCLLYGNAVKAVVRIESKLADGEMIVAAGFVIGSKGLVVTSYRAVAGAVSGEAVSHNGVHRPITGLVAYDKALDVALIKVDAADEELPVLKLALAPPAAETKVVAIGQPAGFADSVAAGLVLGPLSGEEVLKAAPPLAGQRYTAPQAQWLRTSAAINQAYNGGPLLLADGTVAGMNAWSCDPQVGPDLNFAVGSAKIIELITKAAGDPQTLETVTRKEFAGKLPKAAELDPGREKLPLPVNWLPARRCKLSEVQEAIYPVLTALKCRSCNGTGKYSTKSVRVIGGGGLTVEKTTTTEHDCQDCGGSGSRCGDQTYKVLSTLVERGALLSEVVSATAAGGRVLDIARGIFGKSALALDAAAQLKDPQARDVLTSPDRQKGKPVVFFGKVLAVRPYGGSTLSIVSTEVTSQLLFVRTDFMPKTRAGDGCLVGGLMAGPIMLTTPEGTFNQPAIEAFAIEPDR